jgi:hypothetical protein
MPQSDREWENSNLKIDNFAKKAGHKKPVSDW